jgi:hypothetical protein
VQYNISVAQAQSHRSGIKEEEKDKRLGERLSFPHSPYSARPTVIHSFLATHTTHTHTHTKKSRRTIKRRWNPSPSGTSICVFVYMYAMKCVYSGLVLLRVVDDQLGAGRKMPADEVCNTHKQSREFFFLFLRLFVMLLVERDRAILQDALCS